VLSRPLRWGGWLGGIVLVAGAVAVWGTVRERKPACDPKAQHANLSFKLKDMDGRDVDLAAYQGRPLLINFWATWCGPCKDEIPALVELVSKYKSTDLAVLGISIDDHPEDLKKFAADYKVNYPFLVGLGNDELLEAYDAQFAVPVSWFVSAEGCVITKHTGIAAKEWFEARLKSML
jgi:cytochrome c biogenesis protein CcmG/thiol:disulfide interchange protein DsbE